MSKHTPAPWYSYCQFVMVRKPEREYLGEGAPETICEMQSSVSPEETQANQRLIAAAPTLLEACESALRAIEYNLPDEFLPETRAALCAAIARATEDTPCDVA